MQVGTGPRNKPTIDNKIDRVSKNMPGDKDQGVSISTIPITDTKKPERIFCSIL